MVWTDDLWVGVCGGAEPPVHGRDHDDVENSSGDIDRDMRNGRSAATRPRATAGRRANFGRPEDTSAVADGVGSLDRFVAALLAMTVSTSHL
jgi:hypothetical protein